MARRKKRGNNPAGRPSQGLAEAAVLVSAPADLLRAVEVAAKAEAVSVREWWRRAARERLAK